MTRIHRLLSAQGKHMRARVLAAGIVSAALSVTPAFATVLIKDDYGGKMVDYRARFQQIRRSGEPVVIDGICMSACTMILGIVPLDHSCVTPRAVLGFETAWEYDNSGTRIVSVSGTQELMKVYPASVHAWITRHGGLGSKILLLKGRELTSIVPRCRNASRAASGRF